jgi:hypothetical protein
MASPSADYVLHLRAAGDHAHDNDAAGQRCIYAVDCSKSHIRNVKVSQHVVDTRGSIVHAFHAFL